MKTTTGSLYFASSSSATRLRRFFARLGPCLIGIEVRISAQRNRPFRACARAFRTIGTARLGAT
jgi:hypothetical protein